MLSLPLTKWGGGGFWTWKPKRMGAGREKGTSTEYRATQKPTKHYDKLYCYFEKILLIQHVYFGPIG